MEPEEIKLGKCASCHKVTKVHKIYMSYCSYAYICDECENEEFKMIEDDRIELEPTWIHPIKENHVYAVCRCSFLIGRGLDYLDLGEKIPGKLEYRFHCKKCGLNGSVIVGGGL